MLNPREYCFWCMNKLPSADGTCGVCGKDNQARSNDEGELPFALLGGKYLIGHALGRGGFGITYVGLNMMLEKRVAIKEYFPADISTRDPGGINVLPASPETEAEFDAGKHKALEEARIIARVENVSNVVGIYDCFSRNNTVYIIMEFIEGETFAAYAARKGPAKWQEIWPRIRPVGVALGQLHQLNLIHRDISPDNIMIRKDNGESVLLDFGAASNTVAEGQENVTALKDGYAPLEQYQDRAAINGRADEYSWSATLWYMLTGNRPPNALQRKAQQCDPQIPRLLRKRVPETVRRALLKGMAIQQENRYPTMEQLIAALDAGEAGSFPIATKILTAVAVLFLVIMALALIAGILI